MRTGRPGGLRDTEAQAALLDSLFRSSPDGLANAAPALGVRAANDVFVGRIGLPEERVIGQTADDVLPRWTEEVRQAFEQVRDTLRPAEVALGSCDCASEPEGGVCCERPRLSPVSGPDGDFLGWLVRYPRTLDAGEVARRRRMEEEHRRLLRAVEQSPATVVITDVKGTIEYVNPKFTELTGYSFEEALGKNPRVVKSGQTPPEVYRDMWRTIRAGRVWRGELLNKKRNGELYWESISISPATDSTGEITHFVAVKEDITERKRAEEEREHLLTQVNAVLNSTHAHLALLDRDMNFLMVNAAYTQASGHRREELIGRNHFALFPNAENQAIFERVRDTGEPYHVEEKPFEYADQPSRGTTYWNWTLTPIKTYHGRFEGILLSLTDVTPQVRARQQIEALAEEARARSAELNATFASMPDGVVIYGRDGEIIQMNPTAERMLGYTADEAALPIAERLRVLKLANADGRQIEPDETPMARALRGETVIGEIGAIRKSADRPLWISISAAPLFASGAGQTGAVIVYTDITHQRELQERQEDFIRAISHDLRNPLTGILGHVQLIQRFSERAEMVRKSAEAVQTSAKRMNTMIQDLVDSARVESGHLTLSLQPVDLASMLHDLRGRLAEANQIDRVRVEIGEAVPPVLADPARLERILTNLISNALKYSKPPTTVPITAEPNGDEVVLAVHDRGAGIPEDELPHMFERYHRSRNTREQREGLGLGLYITKGLVEAHGGRIWVESRVGEGSVFRFTLPRA